MLNVMLIDPVVHNTGDNIDALAIATQGHASSTVLATPASVFSSSLPLGM